MPYEINSSQLFLTYPRCTATKDDAFASIQKTLLEFPKPCNIISYVVAVEPHADGTPHIHMYLKLDGPCRTKDPAALDLLLEDRYHGNYQGCRSAKSVIKYCTKAENYISNLDVATLLGSKTTREVLGKRLLNGEDLNDLVHEAPQLLFGFSRFKADIDHFRACSSKPVPPPDYLPNTWTKILPYEGQSKKQRHYWIWSKDPNKGKTTFARRLREDHGAVIQAGDFTYWNVTPHTRILILDDYNASCLKWHALNQLADNTYNFRLFQRGTLQIDNFIVIVLSNASIKDLYPFKNDTLYVRFNEIEL